MGKQTRKTDNESAVTSERAWEEKTHQELFE